MSVLILFKSAKNPTFIIRRSMPTLCHGTKCTNMKSRRRSDCHLRRLQIVTFQPNLGNRTLTLTKCHQILLGHFTKTILTTGDLTGSQATSTTG